MGRRATHSVAGVIAKTCAKIDIKDSTSGFRMFKKKTLEKIDFEKIRSDGFAFQIEVLHQLKTDRYERIGSANSIHKQNRR